MGTLLTNSWTDIQKFFGIDGQTTANTAGMTPTQASTAAGAATVKNIGSLTAVFGAINGAIGSFYAAKTQQYQQESQASNLAFQSGMDAINAHGAEIAAQSITEAGKTQVEQYTMKAGQEAATSQVATAARGIDLSSGSAIAERASQDLVKQIDVNTINSNATRAAWAQRVQATNDNNESLLASTSASNLRTSAATISPALAVTNSLLSSATSIASKWNYQRPVQMAGASSVPLINNGIGQ